MCSSSLKWQTAHSILIAGPKSALYAAAGIPEYWIANLRTGEVEVRTDPVDSEYTTVRAVARGGAISPTAFPDLTLQLSEFMPPTNS